MAWPRISRRRLTGSLATLDIAGRPPGWPFLVARRFLMSQASTVDRIGVGIDTARYGHRVSFLRPDRQPAAKPITVMETQAGYQGLREQLERLHQQHPLAHLHARIDAA